MARYKLYANPIQFWILFLGHDIRQAGGEFVDYPLAYKEL